jgi:hypothetical protein
MPTPAEYEARVRKLKWPGVRNLWTAVKDGDTPGWGAGKAFEYLILRAFELNKAEVRWPYSVRLDELEVEQIDGSIRIGGLYALVEAKDEAEDIAIGPIAKMRNQLLRRPAGTIGLVFSRRDFTPAAVLLTRYMLPHAVLLWTGAEVEYALKHENLAVLMEKKFRGCVDNGLPDFDVLP